MSKLCFHSLTRTVEVDGSEKIRALQICHNILCAAFKLNAYVEKELASELLPKESDAYQRRKFDTYSMINYINMPNSKNQLFYKKINKNINKFSLAFNTAYAMGNDTIKFLAMISAFSDLHCFVMWYNKIWLSNIIQEGLELNILLDVQGWSKVIELLREDNENEAVVLSHSL